MFILTISEAEETECPERIIVDQTNRAKIEGSKQRPENRPCIILDYVIYYTWSETRKRSLTYSERVSLIWWHSVKMRFFTYLHLYIYHLHCPMIFGYPLL